jgi:integrase
MKDEMSNRPGSANLVLRVASILYGYALDRDLVAANPVANMKKNKLQGHEKWNPEEVRKLISEADERISIAVALAWYTGQREGDILAMRMGDYADGYITLTQSKTKTEMKIKVHPDLEAILYAIASKRNPESYIVSGTKIMGDSNFRKLFASESKRLGVQKVFHGIRKGVASSLAENGRPISEIAAMLGHKSIRMAAYYAEQADSTKLAESAVSNLTSVTVQASY